MLLPSDRRADRFQFKTSVGRFLVLAVLLSALTCGALSELARLMDDTLDNSCNDFVPACYFMGEILKANEVTVARPAPPVEVRQVWSNTPRRTQAFRSSDSLLLLYSILRT